MSLDIVLWALDNTATYLQPRDLLVFSGNVKEGTDFYNALEALRDRYYNVRVAPHLETCWPHPHHQMSLDHWPKEVVVGFSHGVASLCKQNLKGKLSLSLYLLLYNLNQVLIHELIVLSQCAGYSSSGMSRVAQLIYRLSSKLFAKKVIVARCF